MYQNPFYIFIKMLDEIKEKLPQDIPKYTPQKIHFFPLKQPPYNVLTPMDMHG